MIIIGSVCSRVTEPTAATSAYFNVIQVSPVSTSPALEDRVTYPYLYRLLMSDSNYNIAKVQLFKHFGWNRVGTIHKNDDVYALPTKDLVEKLTENNITVVSSETIQYDSSLAVDNLKKKNVYIIVAFVSGQEIIGVFCEAYKRGMYGPKYVWFVTGYLSAERIGTEDGPDGCKYEQWSLVANYALRHIGKAVRTDTSTPTDSGVNEKTYREGFHRQAKLMAPWWDSEEEIEFFVPLSPPVYDSVWAAALALDQLAKDMAKFGGLDFLMENFTYKSNYVVLKLKEIMDRTDFYGISGHITFGPNGNVNKAMVLFQNVG